MYERDLHLSFCYIRSVRTDHGLGSVTKLLFLFLKAGAASLDNTL